MTLRSKRFMAVLYYSIVRVTMKARHESVSRGLSASRWWRTIHCGSWGFVRCLTKSRIRVKSFTPASIYKAHGYDVVLIGSRTGTAMYEVMAGLKSLNPSVRIIATGNLHNEEWRCVPCVRAPRATSKSLRRRRNLGRPSARFMPGRCGPRPLCSSKFIERVT